MALTDEHLANDLASFRSVLVVDDDEVARNLIANYLRRLGVENIDLYEDGDSAWHAMQRTRYDLLVLDWKLPGLSGIALFNRIRGRRGYRSTPLLVISGLLEKSDFRLLQEFPCTALMEKPFTNARFVNIVQDLSRERIWYGQNVALIDTILDAADQNEKKIEALLKQVLKKAPNPVPLALLAARRLITSKLYRAAERILRGVLAVDDGCVLAMNELGKTLHLSGRHHQALDVLRQANRLSADNIQRLCLLGEVELNLQNPDAARAYFEKVLVIDASDEAALAGLVLADNMQELEEDGGERIGTGAVAYEPPASFASIMNTIGITFVRTGQYQRGISQYQAALNFLRSRHDSARVAFNLGLGYLRWGKPDEALPWFQRSERLADDHFAKSAAYASKLLASAPHGRAAQVIADVGFARIDAASSCAAAKRAVSGSHKATSTLPEKTLADADSAPDDGSVIPFSMTAPASLAATAEEGGGQSDEGSTSPPAPYADTAVSPQAEAEEVTPDNAEGEALPAAAAAAASDPKPTS